MGYTDFKVEEFGACKSVLRARVKGLSEVGLGICGVGFKIH